MRPLVGSPLFQNSNVSANTDCNLMTSQHFLMAKSFEMHKGPYHGKQWSSDSSALSQTRSKPHALCVLGIH